MSPFESRAHFLIELARRLHLAGVAASRLEGAVRATAQALRVSCEIWSVPTGLLMSLGDADDPSIPQQTRVLRLDPGNTDLAALVSLDEIADRVIAGTLGVSEGLGQLHALDRTVTRARLVGTAAAVGLAAAAIAGLLRTGWLDIVVAGGLGCIVGSITVAGRTRPNFASAAEAIAALVVTVLATAFAHFIAPLSMQTVVVAALIVLMPGLTLTTAVTELASQQLVTGTARFAGAIVTLFKLTFGSVAGAQLASGLGWSAPPPVAANLPAGVEIAAAVAASFAFAVLFRAKKRDVPLVMGSALLGYVLTRAGSQWFEVTTATFAGPVFFASMAIGALANAYGRLVLRPGALVRVSGIMLLVPGSVGFRGLALLMERDYALGLETAMAVLGALIALMAGLLFGSILVPPRRYL